MPSGVTRKIQPCGERQTMVSRLRAVEEPLDLGQGDGADVFDAGDLWAAGQARRGSPGQMHMKLHRGSEPAVVEPSQPVRHLGITGARYGDRAVIIALGIIGWRVGVEVWIFGLFGLPFDRLRARILAVPPFDRLRARIFIGTVTFL